MLALIRRERSLYTLWQCVRADLKFSTQYFKILNVFTRKARHKKHILWKFCLKERQYLYEYLWFKLTVKYYNFGNLKSYSPCSLILSKIHIIVINFSKFLFCRSTFENQKLLKFKKKYMRKQQNSNRLIVIVQSKN